MARVAVAAVAGLLAHLDVVVPAVGRAAGRHVRALEDWGETADLARAVHRVVAHHADHAARAIRRFARTGGSVDAAHLGILASGFAAPNAGAWRTEDARTRAARAPVVAGAAVTTAALPSQRGHPAGSISAKAGAAAQALPSERARTPRAVGAGTAAPARALATGAPATEAPATEAPATEDAATARVGAAGGTATRAQAAAGGTATRARGAAGGTAARGIGARTAVAAGLGTAGRVGARPTTAANARATAGLGTAGGIGALTVIPVWSLPPAARDGGEGREHHHHTRGTTKHGVAVPRDRNLGNPARGHSHAAVRSVCEDRTDAGCGLAQDAREDTVRQWPSRPRAAPVGFRE